MCCIHHGGDKLLVFSLVVVSESALVYLRVLCFPAGKT